MVWAIEVRLPKLSATVDWVTGILVVLATGVPGQLLTPTPAFCCTVIPARDETGTWEQARHVAAKASARR